MDAAFDGVASKVRRRWLRFRTPTELERVIVGVHARKLTYLSGDKLRMLASLCRRNERKGVPGAILEAGCALGGSAIVMASSKVQARPMRIYDVFAMIPPPSDRDGEDVHQRYADIAAGRSKGIGGDTYYGYLDNLYERVTESLRSFGRDPAKHNITLVKGLIQDTLVVDGPVSLAHIDVDWYEPVLVSLQRIEPFLSPGGAIVLDDYMDWSGCRRAVDEYFSGARAAAFRRDLSAGSLVLTKSGA